MKNLLFIFITTLLSAYGASSEKKLEPLIVGTTTGYAPFVSLNAQGEYEGFDIDLTKLLSQKLGQDIVIKDFGSMPSLMMALKQGKADMLIWAISITKERLNKMEMIYYQGATSDKAPFLFWEKTPEGIDSISDLEKIPGALLCVEAGSSQEALLKEFPKLSLKYQDKVVVGFVSQSYALFPQMNALENCTHPLMINLSMNKNQAQEKALVLNPSFLLLDEPTSALDPENTDLLISLIKNLQKEGKGFVISTQDMNLAQKMLDYIFFLENGQVKEQYSLQNTLNPDQTPFAETQLGQFLFSSESYHH